MRKRIKLDRPSHATVIAYLALFVALGGSAYAVNQLPKNSVGPKQLRKNAVNSAKVKNRSLEAIDFKSGQLPAGQEGREGAPGPQGPGGSAGATGPAGPFPGTMPSGATYRGQFSTVAVAAEAGETIRAAISYGFRLSSAPTLNLIAEGGPPTAACPGSDSNPQAAPSNLCAYETAQLGASLANTAAAADPRSGTFVTVLSLGAGEFGSYGSWAVTAP